LAVKEGVGFFDHYITQRVTHQIPSICSIFHSNIIKVPLPMALIPWSLVTNPSFHLLHLLLLLGGASHLGGRRLTWQAIYVSIYHFQDQYVYMLSYK
jgi:hypothetical protein